MEMEAALPTPSRPFGWACALVGVDADIMETCPARDRDSVRLLCTLMMLVWLWQSVVFAAVAHLMLARPGEVRPDLIATAMLLATIILLLDAYVVMRPSWTGFGYEELRRGGLAIRLPILARFKGNLFLTLRLALSAVIGTLVALFVSLTLYGKDITGQLAAEHAAHSAPVIATATRLVDEQLTRHASAQVDLRGRIAATDRAAESLRGRLIERVDPAMAAATAEWTRAERGRERAEADVARWRRRGDSAGLARAQHRLGAANAGRDAARVHLDEAESRALTLVQGRDSVLANQLVTLDAQRRQALEQLAASEAEQRRMLYGRAAAIRAAMAADPMYAAPDEGLLARLRALKALTAEPWVATIVLLLEVFFAGVELAAVFAKLLSFVPATYTTRLAREDQIRQIATARDLAAVLANPSLSAAGPALRREDGIPGTLTSGNSPASAEPGDASLAPTSETLDPGQNPSPGSNLDSMHSQQEISPDEATLQAEGESRSPPSSSEAVSPRRRGRPPKAR